VLWRRAKHRQKPFTGGSSSDDATQGGPRGNGQVGAFARGDFPHPGYGGIQGWRATNMSRCQRGRGFHREGYGALACSFDQQDRRHGADGGRTHNQCQITPCHGLPVVVHKPYHRVPPMGGGDNGIGNVTKAAEGNLPKDTNDDINKLPLLDLMVKNPWPSSPDA
jgi:hypothetical protein